MPFAASRLTTSGKEHAHVNANVHALDRARALGRPSRAEVEAAVRTIIRWTGEDPDRDGLIETASRVTRSFEEFLSGYSQDPLQPSTNTFEDTEGYDALI